MNAPNVSRRESPWPHRLSMVLVGVVFPLIWVGGLVTTYDAGMAVPDWPSTYGHNLFLYPWQTWLGGPWDLFVEHGHRLLGAVAGCTTLALFASVIQQDDRRWLRWMAAGAVVLVIFQGLLGGARVLLDRRALAMLHGCTGPAFFAYVAAMAVVTSPRWRQAVPEPGSPTSRSFQRIAVLTVGLAYVQLILGAQLRHVEVSASPAVFRVAVLFHLAVALLVAGHVYALIWKAWRGGLSRYVAAPTALLSVLLTAQLALGTGTWIVKYGWPDILGQWRLTAGLLVVEKSFTQSMIVTLHVAAGSLILAVALVLLLRSLRLYTPSWTAAAAVRPRWEVR